MNDKDFIADVWNEEGAAIAAGEGYDDARPDGAVLIVDAVNVVEPHLDAVLAVRILDADDPGEKRGGPEHCQCGFVNEEAHDVAPPR
jgi:hypothetical protein